MNQHRQLLFFLGVTCLTAADVLLSIKDDLDTEHGYESPSQSQLFSTRSQLTTSVENSTHSPCNTHSNEDINESTMSASITANVGTVTDGFLDTPIIMHVARVHLKALLQCVQWKLAWLEIDYYRCDDIIINTTKYNVHKFMYVYATIWTINVDDQPQFVSDFGLMLYP